MDEGLKKSMDTKEATKTLTDEKYVQTANMTDRIYRNNLTTYGKRSYPDASNATRVHAMDTSNKRTSNGNNYYNKNALYSSNNPKPFQSQNKTWTNQGPSRPIAGMSNQTKQAHNERCMRDGLCFRCGRPGHRIGQCSVATVAALVNQPNSNPLGPQVRYAPQAAPQSTEVVLRDPKGKGQKQ